VVVSELFPLLAQQMDRLVLLRSVAHGLHDHARAKHLMFTGFRALDLRPTGNEAPAVGAVTARFRGANQQGVPAYVAVPRVFPFLDAGYLGVGYDPFELTDPGPEAPQLRTLRPAVALDAERLAGLARHKIVLTGQRRAADSNLTGNALAAASQTAATLAGSTAMTAALDLSRETAAVRDRYGRSALGQRLLLARRLVQAGVTFVTVEDVGWDMHGQLKRQMDRKGPVLDQALSALVDDLSGRGLLGKVLVVVGGEFGRTAKFNRTRGRGDWGGVFTMLLAGGLRGGQVVGSSDALGQTPQTRPLSPQDVLATIYTALGIDYRQTVKDATGQPVPLLADGTPIKELL
jgi:uncharacterized protein (DUF1501 family)